jgi:hypothetical protein
VTPLEFELPTEVAELSTGAPSGGGTKDDDDDRDDEHAGENEIPVRETDEETEAPEEFQVDDEDDPDLVALVEDDASDEDGDDDLDDDIDGDDGNGDTDDQAA